MSGPPSPIRKCSVHFYNHYSYTNLSRHNTLMNFYIFLSPAFTSFQVCHKCKELVQEVDPPPIAHLHSHTLKPEPQEVVLRSIMSGQINYSPFEKCTFFSSPLVPSFPSTVFILGPPERNSQGDKKLLPALSQTDLRSDSTWDVAAVVTQAPKFQEIFSCVVPWRLAVSCPQYPHNAFVEFPKWMKSRFI